MAADFPASPAVNDIYTLGSLSWKWNGTAWDSVVSSTSAEQIMIIMGAY